MTHLSTIIDYLRFEREPIERWRLAAELARRDRVTVQYLTPASTRAESAATQAEYDTAIGEAIAAGKIVDVGGKVKIVAELKESHSQRELF